MNETTIEPLILDLLEWLCGCARSYTEAIDVWRTSCPRLPVWEEANDRGLVAQTSVNGEEFVCITPAGLALLEQAGRSHPIRA